VYVDVYDHITLPAGVSGYFIVRGTISSAYQDKTLNLACIYLNDQKVDCKDVTYTLEPKN
jgi:hypothetical protein